MSAALGQRRHVGPVAQANPVHRHETINSQAPVTHSDNPGITRVDMVQQRVKCFIALPASWRDGAGTVPERATTKGVITPRDFQASPHFRRMRIIPRFWFRSGFRQKRDPAGSEDGQ